MPKTNIRVDKSKLLATAVRNSLGVQKPSKPLIDPKLVADLQKVGEIALVVTAMAGATAITILAPNIWRVMGTAHKWYKATSRATPKQSQQVSRALYYLKERGYITLKSNSLGDYIASLTEKGRTRLAKIEFDSLRVLAQRIWDKQWWCVAADIPTKEHRQGADLLRRKLKHMGFISLQRSMWFYPFDPRKEINYITKAYGIGHFVTVIRANLLDTDDEHKLLKHFKKLRIL